jgi:hypothetical protein
LFVTDIESGRNLLEGVKLEVKGFGRKGEHELLVLNADGLQECHTLNQGQLESIASKEQLE